MTDQAEVDTGEPIAELADFDEDPAPGFVARLWGRIERRRLGGEMVDLTWKGLFAVVIEYVEMVFELLNGQGPPVEPADDEKGEIS